MTRKEDINRAKLCGIERLPVKYDVLRFTDVGIKELRKLVELGYIDEKDNQNDSPTNGEMIQFISENAGFSAHGYIVSPDRYDVRVSLEGVEYIGEWDKEEFIPFVRMFHNADEFEVEPKYLRAWYD